MNINDAYPSKYLKAADLQGRNIPVVIDRVEIEDISRGEKKPVIYFQNKQKGMVLNKVNARNIAALYGDDTDDWAGCELVLFEAAVDFQGKTVPALRVRGPQPKDKTKPKHSPDRIESGIPPRQPVARPSMKDELEDEIPEF